MTGLTACHDQPERHEDARARSGPGAAHRTPQRHGTGNGGMGAMGDGTGMGSGMMGGGGMMGGRMMGGGMMGSDMGVTGDASGSDMMGMMDMMSGMSCQMPDWMMSGQMRMDAAMMRDMQVIHGLLMNHDKIRRDVEDVPGGVRTTTTSTDPDIAARIRAHVHQMKERIAAGDAIRLMDPLFREIFKHHDQIAMQIEEIPGGVRVSETSEDPQVALLIRQHARRAVSEFAEFGMPRAMRPTPLPEGYEAR